MAIRYQLVNEHQNIKNKLYLIVLAFFTVSMTATFSILCIKRKYGEYRGPFLPRVCEPWWNDDTNPPVPVSIPTNTANCGPKKIVWDYVNATQFLAGYIQYCQIRNEPTSSPIHPP
tara:strand:- start:1006 stop:1353 length:348 start_codon:yes stop_codon:yes gene_type:complete